MKLDEKNIASFQDGKRTYFFDIKKTSEGSMYLKIIESKRIGENNFER